jgi:CRP-like cAMP-binding protein
MKTLEALLAEHPFFKELKPDYLRLISECASNVVFKEGEQVFREGEDADYFYVVRHGKVAVEIFVPKQGPVNMLSVEDGDVLGWSWLYPPYKRRFDARAMELTRAAAFDGKCLRDKLANDPQLGYELMKRFAQVVLDRLYTARIQLLDMYGKTPKK